MRLLERFLGRHVGSLLQLVGVGHRAAREVAEGLDGADHAQRGPHIAKSRAGGSTWVDQPAWTRLGAEHGAREEGTQFERFVIEDTCPVRVGRVVELETAVEQEPIDFVGLDPTPDSVRRLHDHNVEPGLGEVMGGVQAGDARSDDHHLRAGV